MNLLNILNSILKQRIKYYQELKKSKMEIQIKNQTIMKKKFQKLTN